MRSIPYSDVVDRVKTLCIDAAHRLPDDVVEALRQAERVEHDERAKHILRLLLDNVHVAAQESIPLCQDTGLTVVFVDQGHCVQIDGCAGGTLTDAINEGVASGYDEGYLRKSVVADPLNGRENTGDNTPAIVHHRWTNGEKLTLSVMLKGGGCENRSRFEMLTPGEGRSGVEDVVVETVRQAGADACPPFVVGVGIGGDFELACLMSKRVLLRRLDQANVDSYYADMEKRLLKRINDLNIGPQGMGGRTTALGVLIETAPCHIASLPVAVNIECHSHRHKTAVL